MKFIKAEATGNDYVYIEADGRSNLKKDQIISMSDRRKGIGSDGVVQVNYAGAESKDNRFDAEMTMWNSDGTYSSMCGNALRTVAFLCYRRTRKNKMILRTGNEEYRAEIVHGEPDGFSAEVIIEMGRPVFEAAKIPVSLSDNDRNHGLILNEGKRALIDIPAPFEHKDLAVDQKVSLLSMGNPHCILFVDDPDEFPVETIGPFIENHPVFPERTNVEFVGVNPDGSLYQRTYERGSGETLSCGSGASAVAVAAKLSGRAGSQTKIHLRGGTLNVEWNHITDTIQLRGPVRLVFSGEYFIEA